jgi:hypothetical protein
MLVRTLMIAATCFLAAGNNAHGDELVRGSQEWRNAMLLKKLPPRPETAITGTEFIKMTASYSATEREQAIYDQIKLGNVPNFIRNLQPVTLSDGSNEVIVYVSPDYLAIGSDEDFIRIPMNLRTASRLSRDLLFTLPTTKIVDEIYEQADLQLKPIFMKPCAAMVSNDYFEKHNAEIEAQIGEVSHDVLVAGHKKDVVLSSRLINEPGQIAIYGWHTEEAKRPVQPLSTVHKAQYADYSHGVRFVSKVAKVNGKYMAIEKVFQDPVLHLVISNESPYSANKVLSTAQKDAAPVPAPKS